jgi:oligopeptide transport system permease protein
LLLLLFGVKLKWFPTLDLGSFERDGFGVISYYVLPVTTLAVYPIASISRMVHSSFTEAMRADYVTMARAKGLSSGAIYFRHVLKNALIPVVTNAGPMMAFLMTGSFVVESVFTINGIGREFVNSVGARDYTVIMGLTIFLGILIIGFNLLADLLCPLVDPRVKLS